MRKAALLLAKFLLLATISGCDGGGPVWPPTDNDGRPADYSLIFPDKICRWSDSAFPLKVYVDPAPADMGVYGPSIRDAAVAGIDIWDGVIAGMPDVFNYEADFDSADIIVRWETMNLDGYTLATEYSSYVAIHKIAISKSIVSTQASRLIMGHELGHVLGLNLSGVHGDLMYSHIDPLSTSITTRDSDMINWLYNRETYVPIRTY
jgi:hypothetical protein